VLAPVFVVGGGLAFDGASWLQGQLYPWFRYYILAVPLSVLLVAWILRATPRDLLRTRSARAGSPFTRPRRWAAAIAGAAVAIAALGPAIPTEAKGMFNASIAPDSYDELGYVVHRHLNATDLGTKYSYEHIVSVDSYLASMHLAAGDVLVDNNQNCIPQLIAMSPNPKIFVIPNDRDFEAVLHDPLTFHTRYLLVPNGGIFSDAISTLYPGIYDTGAGFAKVVHAFKPEGPCVSYHLLHVLAHTGT
jgi:hypothetical protein